MKVHIPVPPGVGGIQSSDVIEGRLPTDAERDVAERMTQR